MPPIFAAEMPIATDGARYQNEYHRLRANLLRAAATLRLEMNRILEPYGLTQQQLNILRILRGAHPAPLTVHEIRERMLDRASDASRLVDRLIAKGLLDKAVCGHDRRLVDICIRTEGLALLADLDTRMAEIDGLLAPLAPDEAEQMNDWLERLQR